MRTSGYRDRLRIRSDVVLVLDVLAAAGQTASYSFIAGMVGLQARSNLFHEVGHDLVREDAAEARPIRMALCVRRGVGLPSASFFDLAEELGLLRSRTPEAEAELHASMLEALGLRRDQGLRALTFGKKPGEGDLG